MTGLLLDLQSGTPTANGPLQWAALALGAVTILYVAVIRPMRRGRSARDPLERKPTQSTLAQQRAIERDMGNLLVQYEEMIRRMTAQVDTRATKLEMLIQEAEGKISQLKTLIAVPGQPAPSTGLTDLPQAGSTQPGLQAGLTASPEAQQVSSTDTNVGTGDPAIFDQGRASSIETSKPHSVEASPLPAGDGSMMRSARKPGDEPDPAGRIDDRHADIYRLADSGRTARQIAQELNRLDGEVELILHLRSPKPLQGDLWQQPEIPAPAAVMPGQAGTFDSTELPKSGSAESRRKGKKKQRTRGNAEF